MDSGAALRANAISAFRSAIRYWSSGAIVVYVLASSACACHARLIRTTDAKHVDTILSTFSRFINFLHQVLIFRGCTRISYNDIQLLLPASLISQAALRGVLGLAFFLNAVQQLLSFAVFATLRIVRADYTHTPRLPVAGAEDSNGVLNGVAWLGLCSQNHECCNQAISPLCAICSPLTGVDACKRDITSTVSFDHRFWPVPHTDSGQ
jgi:hypothetical protein